ncbi:MAG: Gfo/Idh/MocA family oxidoreductase, partial [Kofleriaceae bacterium]
LYAVASRDAEQAKAFAAEFGAEVGYGSYDELLADNQVDAVYISTIHTNHHELTIRAAAAGKHVVCEKPLATTAAAAAALVELAARAGVVAAVPFVYRFHPVVREARARVTEGRAGAVYLIHGCYLQDWLASPDDYNWRIDPALGGPSRAFADIGTHWCDLVEFVTGHRITRIAARTITAFTERLAGKANAFQRADGAGPRIAVVGEDAVTMMFETDRGAAGSVVISQISQGRKNRLWFELDAAHEAITFDEEDPERLWVGSRDRQEIVLRDPARLSPAAARFATLPAGHAQGYGDAFNAFVADTYAAIRDGAAPEGLPSFEDGLRAARITETVLASARSHRWEDVVA